MFYQWGRKDPFTFATSSELWGANVKFNGKYPVKIYTIDGVLIYQNNIGDSNKDKQPLGGVVFLSTLATSMIETIKNPILFYGGGPYTIISQVGHTRRLWDYYWTAYSKGVDGIRISLGGDPLWHNDYLNGYVSQRSKSIYDPCPFGFIVPTNGTYDEFKSNSSWILGSYIGGLSWTMKILGISWLPSLGQRNYASSVFYHTASQLSYSTSTPYSQSWNYILNCSQPERINMHEPTDRSSATSVRCIEFLVFT